jgi:hypothetical protein
LAGGAGSALAGDGDGFDAGFVQVGSDAGFAVAAVRSYGLWGAAGALQLADPFDRGCQLRGVGGVALLDGVVQDDAIQRITAGRTRILPILADFPLPNRA